MQKKKNMLQDLTNEAGDNSNIYCGQVGNLLSNGQNTKKKLVAENRRLVSQMQDFAGAKPNVDTCVWKILGLELTLRHWTQTTQL